MGQADRKKVARYVMDKKHWTFSGIAEKVRKKPAAARTEDGEETTRTGSNASKPEVSNASNDLSLVPVEPKRRGRFVIPVPGHGAPAGSLSGQTFVLTGVFPEVGGGEGLKLGKERVKKLITSFGGKVTSSVSARTDILMVGKDPGFSKVSKARRNAKTRLLSLHDLKVGLEQGTIEDARAKPMLIRSYSKGYGQRRGGPNSKALRASEEELAIANGTKAPPLNDISAPKKLTRLRKQQAIGRQMITKKRKLNAST